MKPPSVRMQLWGMMHGATVPQMLLLAVQSVLVFVLASIDPSSAALIALLFILQMALGTFTRHPTTILAIGAAAETVLLANLLFAEDLILLGDRAQGGRHVELRPGPAGEGPGPAAGNPLLEIQMPQPDASVNGVVAIRAVTRLEDGFYYYAFVAVNGSESVAALLHAVSGGGEVTGDVRIGNAAVGAGLNYRIYVLASPERLPIGSSHIPSNVIWSAAINVVRRAS